MVVPGSKVVDWLDGIKDTAGLVRPARAGEASARVVQDRMMARRGVGKYIRKKCTRLLGLQAERLSRYAVVKKCFGDAVSLIT